MYFKKHNCANLRLVMVRCGVKGYERQMLSCMDNLGLKNKLKQTESLFLFYVKFFILFKFKFLNVL